MKLIIDIPDEAYELLKNKQVLDNIAESIIANGIPLPGMYGRLGDLDELEQRISNFIEHDAHMQDEYTLIRERFILDGIKDTRTLVEANNAESEG